MVGDCCETPAWRAADAWNPGSTPVIDEVDPPRMVSDEQEYVLARRFMLPDGYVAERLFTPPLPDSFALARSESGIVYHQHVGLSAGLSVIDVETSEVNRILDFPTETYRIVNGPGDTVFVKIFDEVWQVSPDGSYEIWGQITKGNPLFYTADGRLIGPSYDSKRVLEFFPDGTSQELTSGFEDIDDVVAAEDGTLFVTDWETGDLTRVDPDGQRHLLQEHILYHDPLDLGLDLEGNLYLSSVTTGFVQIDPVSGAYSQHYAELGHSCISH